MTTRSDLASLLSGTRLLSRSPGDSVEVTVTVLRDGQRYVARMTAPVEDLATIGDQLES